MWQLRVLPQRPQGGERCGDLLYQVVLQVNGLNQPYTYSDMTGAGLNLVVNPPG